jgi:hypothetical protein
MAMIWVGAVVVSAIALTVTAFIGMAASGPADPEEATRAAVKLHAIQREIEVAQMQAALRSEAAHLRRHVAEEFRQADKGRSQ